MKLLIALVALTLFGCDFRSKCEQVDREFRSVITEREVQVVSDENLVEAHLGLEKLRDKLVAELEPALVASLPDPPDSGFELQIEEAHLSRPEDCSICYRLRGKLVGEAAADGVDLDIREGDIDLVFEVGSSRGAAVFVPAEPATVDLGETRRMRDRWKKTFEDALVEQLALIRPRPIAMNLPDSLSLARTQVVVQPERLSVILSEDGGADLEHPGDSLWVNPRHLQRIVQSQLEEQPRLAAGVAVRADAEMMIPVRYFSPPPTCAIREDQIVLDTRENRVSRRPEFVESARMEALLETLRGFEPDVMLAGSRRPGAHGGRSLERD